MTKEFLGDREQALENEYFHRQELRLVDKLRAGMDREAQKRALAMHTPIKDEALLEHFVDLGIRVGTFSVLSLVPLIAVAWVGGKLDERERETILAAAAEHGLSKGSESWALLESWLAKPLDAELLEVWKDYIRALSKSLDPEARVQLKHNLLERAREVAEASGGIWRIKNVSPGEKSMLNELEEAFG